MSVELVPKPKNNEKQPDNSELSKEDFSWFEPDEELRSEDRTIEARLAPEPLSDDARDELLRLEAAEDPVAFVEAKAKLSPWQQHEYEEHRMKKSLLDLQERDPKAFAEQIQSFTDKQRNDFYVFEKQAAEEKAKLQQNIAERRANPQSEDDTDNLLLYSQKLQDPEGFQENYKGLTTTQQTKFRILERGEDERTKAAIAAGSHDITVPELTMDGEAWVTKPGRSEAERATDPKESEDFQLTRRLEAEDLISNVRRELNPDQLNALKAHEKIDEINQGGGPKVEINYGKTYGPIEQGRISPDTPPDLQTQDRMERQAQEAIKASKPGVWSKMKRLFGGKR